jgi:hypothetical protein
MTMSLTLKFSMHRSIIEENFDNHRNFLFDKSKVDIFLKDLNSKLNLLTYKDNIEELYHNLKTTLSTSINKFSFEVSHKKNNRTTNPWYDKECKISRKENNRIPLMDWNSYLKSLDEFPNAMDTIPIIPTKEEVFSLDDTEFGVKRLTNGKAKDIEDYQAEIFKIGGPILILKMKLKGRLDLQNPKFNKEFNLSIRQHRIPLCVPH